MLHTFGLVSAETCSISLGFSLHYFSIFILRHYATFDYSPRPLTTKFMQLHSALLTLQMTSCVSALCRCSVYW